VCASAHEQCFRAHQHCRSALTAAHGWGRSWAKLRAQSGPRQLEAEVGPLLHDRERRRRPGLDLTLCLAALEGDPRAVTPGERLHGAIVRQAAHVDRPDAAIARGEQQPAEERRSDAAQPMRRLDAERRLALAAMGRSATPRSSAPAK